MGINSNLSAMQLIEGPVNSAFSLPSNVSGGGTVVNPTLTIFPRPNTPISNTVNFSTPCFFCSSVSSQSASVRFLNAAVGYNPFSIYINNMLIHSGLDFDGITQYSQFTPGYYTITIAGSNGAVLIRRSVYLADGMMTIAIVNSAASLDLAAISDTACPVSFNNSSCIRVCNLAYYSGAMNVRMMNLTFSGIAFKQVADFSQVRPGTYPVSISRAARPGNTLINMYANLAANRIYTLYVLNWNPSADAVRALLVEDRA